MALQLVVCLKPFLIIDGNKFQSGISTGTKKYDDLIKHRISEDYTKIKDIFRETYNVLKYGFDGTYVYILLTKKNGKKFIPNELDKIAKEIVDPYDVGPDTWMESDIAILNEKEAQQTKYYKNKSLSSIELGVVVDGYMKEGSHIDPTKSNKPRRS